MATFKVIRSHDGLQAGLTFTQPVSPLTEYMVAGGWWAIVPDEAPVAAPKKGKAVRTTARTTRAKNKTSK